MNSKTTRILKEARPLFWPWCAVAMAGALPLVHPMNWAPLIILIGFFAVPLLATLSFGDEFQHRTLSLLLSQPVGRMEIWGEKLSVTVVAVLSAVLVFSLALRATSFHPGRQELAFAGGWIVAITASATFWTLFTRSTVGGVALNIGVQSFISFVVPWPNLADWLRARGYLAPGHPIVPSIVTSVFLCYAGAMLWLGRRALARFQVTGGMAGDDLLMAGPDAMPGAVAGWLRCRPTGAVLNLFRKELRLLRPVWLITLLAALAWSCLTLIGLLHQRGSTRDFETAVVIVGVVSTLMIAILAGSLSMGEERTSGTHSWHLTLPAPALLQWRIKLYTALFAGFVGAGLLPILIGGRLFGQAHLFSLGTGWLVGVVLLTFASFWCACAVNGTVRAALWVLPVMAVIIMASEFGGDAAVKLVNFLVSRFDLFTNFKFAEEFASFSGPTLFWGVAYTLAERFTGSFLFSVASANWVTPWSSEEITLVLVFLWGPALVCAIIQSYRLFRTQIPDSTRSLFRNLLPLAILPFLCSFSLEGYTTFASQAGQHEWRVVHEVLEAVEKIQSGVVKRGVAYPLQLTLDDLAKTSPLSEHTRRALHGARVTVVPMQYLPHRNLNAAHSWWHLDASQPWYLATIYLPGGPDCTRAFPAFFHRDAHMLFMVCR